MHLYFVCNQHVSHKVESCMRYEEVIVLCFGIVLALHFLYSALVLLVHVIADCVFILGVVNFCLLK